METHRTQATVGKNGLVTLHDVPLPEGHEVEVIVMDRLIAPKVDPFPLRGMPYSYIDPFEPAIFPDDWGMVK